MLAKVTGVFRLSRDVELRYTQSGTAVANIGLVSNNKRKDQSGATVEDTCFIDASAWGKAAEIMNQHLSKGQQIYVLGELRQETWQDQSGNNRSRHTINIREFEFIGNNGQSNGNQQQNNANHQDRQQQMDMSDIPQGDDDDDSIPF